MISSKGCLFFLLFLIFWFYGITSNITWSNEDLLYQWHLNVVVITSQHDHSTLSELRFCLTSAMFPAYWSLGWWKLLAIDPPGNKVNVLSWLNNVTKEFITISSSIFLVNTSKGGDSSFKFFLHLKILILFAD